MQKLGKAGVNSFGLFFWSALRMSRGTRFAYALVALIGSACMYHITSMSSAHAAQVQPEYSIQQEIDSRKDKEAQLDQHLATSDTREKEDIAAVNDRLDRQGSTLAGISDKVSTITGVGGTILAILGILNMLGFISPARRGKHEHQGTQS